MFVFFSKKNYSAVPLAAFIKSWCFGGFFFFFVFFSVEMFPLTKFCHQFVPFSCDLMFPSFALLTIIRPRPGWPSLEGRFSPTAAGCFPPKVFPFCQAQPFMCANAVFLCQRFLVVKAKLYSFLPLWGGLKLNHKPAGSTAYSIVKAKASFGLNQFCCAKDFWLWTPNFSVSCHCEGFWNQPTNCNCEAKRNVTPAVQIRALKFLYKSWALKLDPRDE